MNRGGGKLKETGSQGGIHGGTHQLSPDGAPEDTQYPSGFICPFHFKNPATGRATLVE